MLLMEMPELRTSKSEHPIAVKILIVGEIRLVRSSANPTRKTPTLPNMICSEIKRSSSPTNRK
jgi:hypothetical protein